MRLLLLLIVAAILASCTPQVAPAMPSPVPAAALATGDTRTLDLPRGKVISRSPDGRWLAAEQGQELCIYHTATLAEQRCLQFEAGPIDSQHLAWSPDGLRIAFTEHAFLFAIDADLWVLNLVDGILTNRTDDGVSGRLRPDQADEQAQLDTLPSWSPDGDTLLFSRVPADLGRTEIYQIGADDGAPTPLLTASSTHPFALVAPPVRSVEGRIVYALWVGAAGDPANGLWVAEQHGRDATQIAFPADRLSGPLRPLGVSADGTQALILDSAATTASADASGAPLLLLDLNQGSVEPLRPATGATPGDAQVVKAILSPDRTKLLYVYRDGAAAHLAVRDLAGANEQRLLSDETSAIGFVPTSGLGLDWAIDNTIFVATGPQGGLLIDLIVR
jgi:Tol biopolymer transport system component